MCVRNTCLPLDKKNDVVACDVPTFLKLVEKAEMMMQERRYSSLNLLLFFGSTIWYNNNT
jgi:hypothetical protein